MLGGYQMESTFFAGFADEMQKLGKMSERKRRAVQTALAGLGLGVVGGVTEGIVSPITQTLFERRMKRKKKEEKK